MKCALWIFFLLIFVSKGVSQHTSENLISVNFNDESLVRAVKKIKNKSGLRAAFNTSDLKYYRVNGEYLNIEIGVILNEILPEGIEFNILNDLIVIYKTEQLNPPSNKPTKFNFELSGKVTDFFTQETLPYATLEVLTTGLISQSNQEGEFKIQKIPSDTSNILVSYVGYRDRIINVSQLKSQTSCQIRMKPEATIIDGVLIEFYEATPIMSKKEVSSFSVNVLRIPQVTNLGETDALALVKALPGFDSSTENNLGLGTRGLRYDENLYFMDGISIFNPDHFFSLFSSLNSLSVKNIRVLKGAYDSSFGGRSGSVFDITSYDGSGQKFQGKVKTGLISSSARLEGSIVSERVKLSITGRRSHPGVFNTGLYRDLFNSIYNSNISFAGSDNELDAFASEVQPKVEFMDLQGKMTFNMKKNTTLVLSSFFSEDFSSILIRDSLLSGQLILTYENEFKWTNYGGSLSLKHPVSKKSEIKYLLSYSDFSARSNSLQTIIDPSSSMIEEQELQSSFDNNVTDLTVKAKWDYFISDSLKFFAGFESNSYSTRVSESSFAELLDERIEDKLLVNSFAQLNVNRTKWASQIGARAIGDRSVNDAYYFEPRVKFNYFVDPKVSVKAGYGKHHQFLRKTQDLNFFRASVDEWRLSGATAVPVSIVDHFILGSNFESENWQLGAEMFLVNQQGSYENLTTLFSQANQNSEQVIFGDLLTKGVEVTGQLNVKRNNFSLSYAFYDSVGEYDINGQKESVRNGRVSDHNLSALWLWENDNIRLSLNSILTSGKPYTPVIGSYTLELANQTYRPFLVFGDLNDANYSNYFRTDFSIGYRTDLLNSIDLELSGSVQNIFNNQNIRFYSYSIKDTNEPENFLILQREVRHLKRLYSLFLTLNF